MLLHKCQPSPDDMPIINVPAVSNFANLVVYPAPQNVVTPLSFIFLNYDIISRVRAASIS